MTATQFIFSAILVALVGCAHGQPPDIRWKNVENLKRLQIGMSEQEVGRIMGTDAETVREAVYYQGRLIDYQAIEVRNPYKVETRPVGGKTYRVLYYYAEALGGHRGYWDRSYREANVPDDSLTPLVFEEGRLIGIGRAFAEEKGLFPEDEWDPNESMLWGR